MRKFATLIAIIVMALSAGSVLATKPDDNGQHQVWVCKYVGQPGDFETLKPGKQPIIVDVAAADAFVGADFADGQNHSLVIDLATDANTGQGERYIGEAACPTVTSTATPTLTPTASSSVEPTVTPTVTPSVSPTFSPSPDPTKTLSPTPTPLPTPTTPTSSLSPTLPPTDTVDGTEGITLNIGWVLLILSGVSLVLLTFTPKRR